MMRTPIHSSERGFTLVETLVAIAIIMIAIVGPYYSIQQAIVTSYAARDQLIASSLAQSGEEYIYFLRDNNYLQSASWTAGLDACFSSDGCVVDPMAPSIGQCSSNGCPPLRLKPNGLYTQDTSYPTVTRFTRTVKITNISANEMEVAVTVNWITSSHSYSVKTTEDLYNWL